MQITLTLLGSATSSDITDRLSERAGIRLRQESRPSNRDRFLDDIKLEFANHDRYFTGLFASASPTARWQVTISENGRPTFRGEIENATIHDTPGTDWVAFDVFSLEKVFLERAKRTRILTKIMAGESGRVYTTLGYLMDREIMQRYRSTNVFAGLVSGIDMGTFNADPIRFTAQTIYTSLGVTEYGVDYVQESSSDFAANGVTTATAKGCKVLAYKVPGGAELMVAVTGTVISVDQSAHRIYVDRWSSPPETDIRPSNGSSFKIGIHPTIGLEGLWTRLDPTTTIAELILAVAGEKDAEFYIDPDTLKFTMRPRGQIISDRATTEGLSLDNPKILLEESTPVIKVLDEDRYDYVRLEVGEPTPPTPSFVRFVDNTVGIYGEGLIYYAMTLVFGEFETNAGEKLEVVNPGTFTTPQNLHEGKNVVISVPASGIPGVTARRLYRTDLNDEEGRLRFLDEVAGDAVAEYEDDIYQIFVPDDPLRPANESYPPSEVETVGMWIRFDTDTNSWDSPVIDAIDGLFYPEGKVLEDPVPKLRFTELSDRTKIAPNPALHMVKFFGLEAFSQTHRDRWRPYFLKRRGLIVQLRGLDYRVGDSILAGQKLFDGDEADDRMVIKSVEAELTRDFSEVNLRSL